jgi:hypothetical protein
VLAFVDCHIAAVPAAIVMATAVAVAPNLFMTFFLPLFSFFRSVFSIVAVPSA